MDCFNKTPLLGRAMQFIHQHAAESRRAGLRIDREGFYDQRRLLAPCAGFEIGNAEDETTGDTIPSRDPHECGIDDIAVLLPSGDELVARLRNIQEVVRKRAQTDVEDVRQFIVEAFDIERVDAHAGLREPFDDGRRCRRRAVERERR